MCRRTRVARCLVLGALGIALAAPAAQAGGLDAVDVSGSIASSYFYNTNRPGNNSNTGLSAGAFGNAYHPSHDQFQIDEAIIDLSKAATDESRVGFQMTVALGELGDIQGSGAGGGNGIWLGNAYIDYLTPFGATITAGKFGTHIGYETVYNAQNVMVTRGFTFNLLQPVDQIGAKASMNIAGIDVMVGAVNGVTANQPDPNGSVDFVWSLGLGNDKMSASFNGQYGSASDTNLADTNENRNLLLDGIIELTPNDWLLAWLNVTYAQVRNDGAADPDGIGINVGGRVAATDKLGIAARVEYGKFENGFPGGTFAAAGATDAELLSVTGTFDYMLVPNLVAKFEVKWDHALDVDGASDEIFGDDPGNGFDDEQVLLGLQLVYAF